MQNKFPIITFNYPEGKDSKRLFITIETERLLIQTVTMDDACAYQQLFEDPNVMTKYASGNPVQDPNYAANRIQGWVERWGNDDPFNGMAVFLKDTKEFVGHVVIGRSGTNGISELAYLFHSKFWGKRYGSEAVVAVVNYLALEIIKRKMLLDGIELSSIEATTRIDHFVSQKILRKVGMETDGVINHKFNAQRYIFNVSAKKLLEMSREHMVNPEQQKAPSKSLFGEMNTKEAFDSIVLNQHAPN